MSAAACTLWGWQTCQITQDKPELKVVKRHPQGRTKLFNCRHSLTQQLFHSYQNCRKHVKIGRRCLKPSYCWTILIQCFLLNFFETDFPFLNFLLLKSLCGSVFIKCRLIVKSLRMVHSFAFINSLWIYGCFVLFAALHAWTLKEQFTPIQKYTRFLLLVLQCYLSI